VAVTRQWIDTLLAVHGFEVFLTDRFNADPHPGNIVVMGDGRLGLIDYGQCKELGLSSRVTIARLIVALAERRPQVEIAKAFRDCGYDVAHSFLCSLLCHCSLSVRPGLAHCPLLSLSAALLTVRALFAHGLVTPWDRMRTANDEDEFMADFAGLLFGKLSPEMMDRSWHQRLHSSAKRLC
jgi:hypothetical protein